MSSVTKEMTSVLVPTYPLPSLNTFIVMQEKDTAGPRQPRIISCIQSAEICVLHNRKNRREGSTVAYACCYRERQALEMRAR